MMETITIEVGEKKNVKFGVLSYYGLVYCGMPNSDTFSLGYKENVMHQGYGLNIFYPKNSKDIRVGIHKFKVLSVSPQSISLELNV